MLSYMELLYINYRIYRLYVSVSLFEEENEDEDNNNSESNNRDNNILSKTEWSEKKKIKPNENIKRYLNGIVLFQLNMV